MQFLFFVPSDMQGSLDLEMNAQCQNMDLSSVFRVRIIEYNSRKGKLA